MYRSKNRDLGKEIQRVKICIALVRRVTTDKQHVRVRVAQMLGPTDNGSFFSSESDFIYFIPLSFLLGKVPPFQMHSLVLY